MSAIFPNLPCRSGRVSKGNLLNFSKNGLTDCEDLLKTRPVKLDPGVVALAAVAVLAFRKGGAQAETRPTPQPQNTVLGPLPPQSKLARSLVQDEIRARAAIARDRPRPGLPGGRLRTPLENLEITARKICFRCAREAVEWLRQRAVPVELYSASELVEVLRAEARRAGIWDPRRNPLSTRPPCPVDEAALIESGNLTQGRCT